MNRTAIVSLLLMTLVQIPSAYAQIYTWTDEQKTVHFTEDPGSVPKAVRDRVRLIEEPAASAPVRSPASPPQTTPDAALKQPVAVETPPLDASETYAGRTYEQWESEFRKREADMTELRKRIDETAASLNSYADDWDKQRVAFEKYKGLLAEFKAMKAEYLQRVETARSAGLQINIQQ